MPSLNTWLQMDRAEKIHCQEFNFYRKKLGTSEEVSLQTLAQQRHILGYLSEIVLTAVSVQGQQMASTSHDKDAKAVKANKAKVGKVKGPIFIPNRG